MRRLLQNSAKKHCIKLISLILENLKLNKDNMIEQDRFLNLDFKTFQNNSVKNYINFI